MTLLAGPGSGSLKAMIFYATGDPGHNTNAPVGALAGSGWQYEGLWNTFVGTAIAPHYFITAKHVGGTVGDSFILQGVSYTTTAAFEHPQADLRIWRVRQAIPGGAELYERNLEVGRNVVFFGRGSQRGEAVLTATSSGSELKGWQWGASDYLMRWGENKVAAIFNDATNGMQALKMNFDAGEGENEAILSGGDSGGGVFIQDGPSWKLAGVNWGVDGLFNTNSTGGGFYAAIFDMGGLYGWQTTGWFYHAETLQPQPSACYATRISSYISWIGEILAQPIPPELLSSSQVGGNYTHETAALVNPETKTIEVPVSANSRFYRLEDTQFRRITSISLKEGILTVRYE